MGQMGERLAPKGSCRLGAVQAARPAAEGGGIGDAIRVLQRGRRLFPRTVFHQVSPQRLSASPQAVMGVGEREQGKEGESLPTNLAKAASDPNPVVMFIVRLLAPATVADDGIAFAKRASPQQDLLAITSPVGFAACAAGQKVG